MVDARFVGSARWQPAAPDSVTDLRPSPQIPAVNGKREQVVHAVPTGPRSAPSFRDLFLEYGSYVASSLRRLGVRDPDIEDVTHDVFLAVFRHLPDYDPERPAKPWLFGFAVKTALGHRRKKSYTREVITVEIEAVDGAPSAEEAVAARQSRDLVIAALQAVSEERRPVFVMHDIDAIAMPDIAATLSIPLNTGYSRLRLARAEFAAAVQRLRGRSAP